ncbi:MAG: hypothetical protein HYT09_03230 [Candidatus Levybacteria bacterium]|nr:hypothetical protein [Candidatus Levybacteria bacterium]MBI4098026.1 hypothetical protein [Candidatus Levybacteria bacterium]
MKRVFLFISFFLATPFLLLASAVFYSYLSYLENPSNVLSASNYKAYTALPEKDFVIEDKIIQEDSRKEMLRQFFSKYSSPLEPFSEDIVNAADKYEIDFRLVPAIAMQESTLCNNLPSKLKDSYNCWGFGIYGAKVTRFSDFSEAIETISKSLATKYKEQGLDTPEEIMTKYTPASNGSWAANVNLVMNQLQ